MQIKVCSKKCLRWKSQNVQCALGRNGITLNKKEGDGATPAGIFPLRQVFFRADRLRKPKTALPIKTLEPQDGWSDDPSDPAYNTLIKRPYRYQHEALWRDDHVYDVIVELGQNDNPPKPGYGSAIFLHVAQPDFSPTEGCIAVKLEDLLLLLTDCNKLTTINILNLNN
ncbi:MAG: L,D-transpeptidase family protein [Pseudomonadota bacterium]|nr:L,D-transpeptidase family protein [Pseudomonadota bacterium]